MTLATQESDLMLPGEMATTLKGVADVLELVKGYCGTPGSLASTQAALAVARLESVILNLEQWENRMTGAEDRAREAMIRSTAEYCRIQEGYRERAREASTGRTAACPTPPILE